MTGERRDGWDAGRPGEPLVHVVEATAAGTRLDRFLAGRIPELSRARLQGLIRQGFVTSPTGTPIDAAHKVRAGEAFRVDLPAPEPAEPAAESLPLAVVYEDEHLIVIDKPAGLVVHPAAGHAGGTLVNALLAHCGASLSGIGGVKRPGIVHRLDKDTSGLLVVAKSDAAHQGLATQFASHGADGRLSRTYLAFVWGAPARRTGVIEARLGRSRTDRRKITVVSGAAGRHAVTRYEVIETLGPGARPPIASLVRLTLETGRTHQIRVHLAHIGHPIIGDAVYGTGFKSRARALGEEAQAAIDALGRQALHAAGLGFEHPVTGARLAFESELPADMARLERALSDGFRPSGGGAGSGRVARAQASSARRQRRTPKS